MALENTFSFFGFLEIRIFVCSFHDFRQFCDFLLRSFRSLFSWRIEMSKKQLLFFIQRKQQGFLRGLLRYSNLINSGSAEYSGAAIYVTDNMKHDKASEQKKMVDIFFQMFQNLIKFYCEWPFVEMFLCHMIYDLSWNSMNLKKYIYFS